jgi:hypothetical protein
MNWIKRVVIVVGSTLILFAVCNFVASRYLFYYANNKPWILAPSKVEFYRKYQKLVHHLRSPDIGYYHPHLNNPVENLLYTAIGNAENGDIVIAGDSWAERFATGLRIYNQLKKQKKNHRYILSGVSSYSPTLIGASARLLRTEFSVKAHSAFIIIDNTDIGDELCRYRPLRKTSQGHEVVVTPPLDGSIFNVDIYLQINDILNGDDLSIKKLFLISMTKIKYMFRKRNDYSFNDIQKYLYNISSSEANQFLQSLEFMISDFKKFHSGISIYILTLPHRQHISGLYKISANTLIKEFFQIHGEMPNVHHVDFTKQIESLLSAGSTLDEIYQSNDPASHLTDFGYEKILIPFILNTVASQSAEPNY